jgi:hypothetical protein
VIPADSFGATLMAVAVLGVFALAWGAWRIWRGGDRKKASLMLVVAVVLVANLLIWTV